MRQNRRIAARITAAKREGRKALDLSRQNLGAVPEALAGFSGLTELDLSVNGLTAVPEWIGDLTGLSKLNLYGNRIESLPESIGNLVNLTELNLGENQLTALPESIGGLTALTRLDLDRNQLAALPDSIGDLTRLVKLDLYRNLLTTTPPSIARLSDLASLDLGRNRLQTLPEPITELTGLTQLDLKRNRLSVLPESIGELANLIRLDLEGNRLTTLPESIAALTQLTRLDLTRNHFASLPESIGELANLIRLDLEGNRLSTLPESITKLDNLTGLYMEGNLLPPEVRAAAAAGLPALRELTEGIATESAVFREAKLVVVGEGEVGKSSLLAAMRGEPFDPARGSTHGIEVKTLPLPGGDPSEAITLNAWDFGGQKAYRPTHQLFFTAPAVYAVVWKARQGPMQGFVDYWIDLIRRRTSGEDIRVHVVATHVDTDRQYPRIDQVALRQAHGDVIAGFHFVDSATGTGIPELKAALWATASRLPQIDRRVPASWRDLRSSLIESDEAYLEYPDYLHRAASYGLDEDAAQALAKIATELGYWIHYPEIRGLDEIVVLKGDWLSTAVSLVLDDAETAGRHGLVEHRRLRELWDDPSGPVRLRYDPKFHQALLRLMEKYDISYRIAEERERNPTSLIAQLVDDAAPPLASVWEGFGADLAEETQICEFIDAKGAKGVPEGLMHQLIVRWHRYSLGRDRYEDSVHWHGGFVIEPRPYERALIRLDGQRLHMTVKAVYPSFFLDEFTRDLEEYVKDLWPGFKLKRLVPCGGQCLDPAGSKSGLFGHERLLTRRRAGKEYAECRRCWMDLPIDALIQSGPGGGPSTQELGRGFDDLAALRADFRKLDRFVRKADADARAMWSGFDHEVQKMLRMLSDEAALGPRLYTIELRDSEAWHRRLTHVPVRVVLWCEHSRLPLYVLDDDAASGVFEVDMPRDWLVRSAPWINRSLTVLRAVLPWSTAALDLGLGGGNASSMEHHMELAEESVKVLTEVGEQATAGAGEEKWMAADSRSGAELRRLHDFLNRVDPGYGGLERVQDRGKFLWVHPDFVNEYEPGAPSFV